MQESPQRPQTVPERATWVPDFEKWELAETDPRGQRHGEYWLWRSDGSPYLRARYESGVQHGPFVIFHPNGEVAREGVYAAGEIDGLVVAYASNAPTQEVLRGCCVPPGAWQMKARYEQGQLQRENFYDSEGRALLSDGSRKPERPESLPERVEFDEFSRRWVAGATDLEGKSTGVWRYWSVEGRLDEESEYADGRRVAQRLYAPDGELRLEAQFVGEDAKHGAWRRRFVGDEASPYADPRVREERGEYHHGQMTGTWRFLDGDARELRTAVRGRPLEEGDCAGRAVYRDEGHSALEWLRMATAMRSEGRMREALCAAARAVAVDGDAGPFRALLAEAVVPLAEDAAARETDALAQLGDDGVGPVLGALLVGADPAMALRTLASVLKGANRASHDFVEAAIRVGPPRSSMYLTRALIRIELGERDGAREDADRVGSDSADTADFLRTYLRVLFPSFTFWPAREPPRTALEGMPDAAAQTLEAVRAAVMLYATRLLQLREALVGIAGPAEWLPPDPAALLPDGPVPLRNCTAEIIDETEEGESETTSVIIDETLQLEGWGVPALMRAARSHWAAICWLCWSAGLDEVALPEAITAREDFASAVGMAIGRQWRAQDALVTGGLRAMTAGVEGFVWEGMEIDGIPKLFAELARDEYLEMRSVFLWLSSPENLSPFQSDLRAA